MQKKLVYKRRPLIVDVKELENGDFEVEGKKYTPEEFEAEFEPEKSNNEAVSVGSFIIKKEGHSIKIQHKKLDFSTRIYAGAMIDIWFEKMTGSVEARRGMDILASGIKYFTISAIQSPKFFHSFCIWNKKYNEEIAKEAKVSEGEDQRILQEQKAMYEEEHKDGDTGTL